MQVYSIYNLLDQFFIFGSPLGCILVLQPIESQVIRTCNGIYRKIDGGPLILSPLLCKIIESMSWVPLRSRFVLVQFSLSLLVDWIVKLGRGY